MKSLAKGTTECGTSANSKECGRNACGRTDSRVQTPRYAVQGARCRRAVPADPAVRGALPAIPLSRARHRGETFLRQLMAPRGTLITCAHALQAMASPGKMRSWRCRTMALNQTKTGTVSGPSSAEAISISYDEMSESCKPSGRNGARIEPPQSGSRSASIQSDIIVLIRIILS